MDALREALQNWLLGDPATRVPLTLTALGIASVLPLVAFVAYMWRMSTRVIEQRTFPPSGCRVFGKPHTITGDAALTQARRIRLVAILFVAVAIALVFFAWRLAMLLAPRQFID